MKNKNRAILTILLLAVLTGCATPFTQSQRDSIQTVAIINEFPPKPNYAVIGTTVFNNDYDDLDGEDYLDFVSEVAAGYLRDKGHEVSIFEGEDPALDKDYDLVITLIPRDIYQMPGTNGYGINQRSMFGVRSKAFAYTALNISPELHGTVTGNAYYHNLLTPLPIEELPEKWSLLTEAQQIEAEKLLRDTIRRTITELMREVGL